MWSWKDTANALSVGHGVVKLMAYPVVLTSACFQACQSPLSYTPYTLHVALQLRGSFSGAIEVGKGTSSRL